MRVRVDADRCQGHARCWSLCPEVFSLDDEGHSYVTDPGVPSASEERAREAARNCPERAIQLS